MLKKRICSGMSWNKDGDLLAIINERNQFLLIWENSSNKVRSIETGLRDPLNFLLWSKQNPNLLAVTTTKGSLLLYNHHSSRKIPILGKHSKRIISGDWSNHRLLALIGEDRVLSISNEEGDTLNQTLLKGEPSHVKFGRLVGGGSGAIQSDLELDMIANNLIENNDQSEIDIESDNCIAIVLNRKQLLLLSVQSPSDQPTVLAFAEKYGDIIDYDWLTERDQLLVAFQNGYVVLLNSSLAHVGQELAYVKVFKENLNYISVNHRTSKVVAISANT